jgi:hypothetical protein
MTSQINFTVALREGRVAKSQTHTHHGIRLHTSTTSRSTPNEPLTGGFITFHFPPPTGVGATPMRRPLPMVGWNSRTTGRHMASPVAVEGGDR